MAKTGTCNSANRCAREMQFRSFHGVEDTEHNGTGFVVNGTFFFETGPLVRLCTTISTGMLIKVSVACKDSLLFH